MTSQQYCLRWNNHRSNLLSVFEDLLHNAEFTDVTLAVEDGRTVKCHRIVLAACSTYFQTLFNNLPSQYQHPIIILKDVGYTEIKAILEYMYRGEVNVAQNQLSDLLRIAQVLKVKGLVEEHGSQGGTARDLRRENAAPATDTSAASPPPAISTSTGGGGGGGGGDHSSPLHSTGTTPPPHYSSLYGQPSAGVVAHDRVQGHLAPAPSMPWLHSGASHQLPTSLSSFLGGASGSYDNGSVETSPFKRRKLLPSSSSSLPMNDTPILRTVLGQAGCHVDGSQAVPLLQPDSGHEPTPTAHYRNASSGSGSNSRSANDSDNRRSNDLAHTGAETTHHADVSNVDEDERQPSPQPYGGDTVRNSGSASNSDTVVSGDPADADLSNLHAVYCRYLRAVAWRSTNDLHFAPCEQSSSPEDDRVRGTANVTDAKAAADCAQPKPEWKRYKQYTRDDISQAIDAVKRGMSAVQAARKFGVPSRTLYDKVKKLGIPTSRPFKRSASNGSSGACFPYGIGANVNGALYDGSGGGSGGGGASTLSENENEGGSSNINVVSLAGTSSAASFEATYAKATKDTPQDRDSMSDSMVCGSASPVIHCAKQRQQRQQQQQDLDDQVEDLSVSRKSDVSTFRRVIVPPSTTSPAIKDEAQEAGLDSSDCCDYS